MNNPRITVPRDQKTLEFYLDKLLPINLSQAYLSITTGQTVTDFYESVLIPMAVGHVFGDELVERGYESKEGVTTYDILMIACGYLTEAKVAQASGDRRSAWSAAMEAMAYCASTKNAANYVNGVSDTIAAEVEQAVATAAAKAAAVRAARHKEVGAAAVRMIKEQGESGKTWISASAAAVEIIDAVNEKAGSIGMRFNADDGGLKTITKYLTSAPELACYFTQKRGRPKKNRS